MTLSKNQILSFGLTAHLLAAYFSVGYHQCDELFQVYEFAGYKLGMNTAGELPWEFHERMRSGIQPLMAYLLTKALQGVSIHNPFTVSLVMRLFQSLLAVWAMVFFLRRAEEELPSPKRRLWLWGASLLCWCLPYFHARFSSENFSATVFLFGLALVLQAINNVPKWMPFFYAGVLFGVSFVCRFQMSFMIAGLLGWLMFVKKINIRFTLPLALGIIAALGIGLLADKWLYGQWTLSWWNYLDLNLFHDKASQFGREPFYYYIGEGLLQLIPPFSLIIGFSIISFWLKFKSHVMTWITLSFILLHFFVAHKELRFLFPVLNFLPFMVLYYFQSLETTNNRLLNFIRSKGFIRFAVIVNTAALLAFIFKPADDTSQLLKTIYDKTEGEQPVLLYENRNPYNNAASLHYFRKPGLLTRDINTDTLRLNANAQLYFLSEKFNEGERLTKGGHRFVRVYSNFPEWFVYLNFNGWLDRAATFSIYRTLH